MTWPTDEELRAAGIRMHCPDCGEFLWSADVIPGGAWLTDCPACGWSPELPPDPDDGQLCLECGALLMLDEEGLCDDCRWYERSEEEADDGLV